LRASARDVRLVEQAPPIGLLEQFAHVAQGPACRRGAHGALEIDDRVAVEDAGALLPFGAVADDSHLFNRG